MSDATAARASCPKSVFRIVVALLPALFTSALAGAVVALPNQILDIYRDIAQTITLGPLDPVTAGLVGRLSNWREAAFAVAAAVGLALVIWRVSCSLLQPLRETEAPPCLIARLIQTYLPVGLAVLPVAMLAVGLWLARPSDVSHREILSFLQTTFYETSVGWGGDADTARQQAKSFADDLGRYNVLLGYFSLAVALVAVVVGLGVYRLGKWFEDFPFGLPTLSAAMGYTAVSVVLFVVLALIISSYPLEVGSLLTPLPIVFLFCACLLLVMGALRYLSVLTGYPVQAALVGLAVIFSFARLNDNHAVRYLSAGTPIAGTPGPPAAGALKSWLKSRDDSSAFSGRAYPVYVVAAQGGGAYAAYYAGAFLAGVEEMCPSFAHHLFAISGVSGGSVGASLFNALMREAESQGKMRVPATGCTIGETVGPPFVDALTAVLSKDLWAPLEAALLFPDFLQRFLFWPVPSFDRALALERALEGAWR